MKIMYVVLLGAFFFTSCDSPGAGTATGNSEDSTTIQNNSSNSQSRTPDTVGEPGPTVFGSDSNYTKSSDTPGYPAKKK